MTEAGPGELARWESAYLRFETPQEEIRKFVRRLHAVGAPTWPRDARITELFCGRGNGLTALEELGFSRLTGVDLSWHLVRQYGGRAAICVADCRVLPLRSGSQTVAIVQGGLHHLPDLPSDLEQVLDEAHRVLSEGGRLVVVEPWLTPFLQVVHHLGCSGPARRLWGKMDALATMIALEGETYRRWLREPALILSLLQRRFEPELQTRRFGKLTFVGRKR
jgi:SAM-dependent methyltransferase